MRIDDVVVINLPSRPDRLRAFELGLPVDWPLPTPRVVPGVVATPPPYWRVQPGAYGCALAHVRVLEHAFRSGVKSLLVLEDDAVFGGDFTARWRQFQAQVPSTWGMVMLGGEHKETPLLHGRIFRAQATTRTHAYVIRDRAMPLLMRTWKAASTHIDHLLPALQKTHLSTYCPQEWLVGQRSGRSDITGHTHADRRFWDFKAMARLGRV
jgi:glycosyl transferase family 25